MELEQRSLVPDKYHFLSGSWLKLIALVSMLIDHTAFALLQGSETVLFRVAGRSLRLYSAMRLAGRLAFPLFAFLLVEGFLYTRDRKRYGIRMLLFALISELPWNLEHTGTWRCESQNVFFTLLLGYLGLCVIQRLETAEGRARVQYALLLLGLLLGSVLLRADYGCSGFGFILTMYILRGTPICRAAVGCCFLSSRWQAGLAFIPIAFYNGKRGFIRGKTVQLLFYAVYPIHMLILYWIRLRTIGY